MNEMSNEIDYLFRLGKSQAVIRAERIPPVVAIEITEEYWEGNEIEIFYGDVYLTVRITNKGRVIEAFAGDTVEIRGLDTAQERRVSRP